MRIYFSLIAICLCCWSITGQPNFTFDEFFNSSYFPSLSLSPNGQYLLVHRRRPAWALNTYENSLWLYDTQRQERKLITEQLSEIFKPKWSPEGNCIVLLIENDLSENNQLKKLPKLHIYNIVTEELLPIDIGARLPLALTWAHNESSLYFSTMLASVTQAGDMASDEEWKDVIRYRQPKASDRSSIYQLNIVRQTNMSLSGCTNLLMNVNFSIGELLFSPSEKKLIFTSRSMMIEDFAAVEMYAMDLANSTILSRLTNNEALELNIQLSLDGKSVYYQTYPIMSNNDIHNNTQQRLYSVDISNGSEKRIGEDFHGNILGYSIRSESGVFILGHVGINVQIYIQQSPTERTILQHGWDGTYDSITASSSTQSSSIAFLHSSFERPEEIYFVDRIDQLESARAITAENRLFTERNLPRSKSYQWTNPNDGRTIEGILHYPPGKFEQKNLPLLVLMHGGPADASLNLFHANWLTWAPMAATEGWLVFEPNYRGSTGYGDQFVDEIRFQVLTLPGQDVLTGVDRLIADGIVDPNQMTIGGFSYGGFLTNWLITQTRRFNAAVSGAGAIEQVSFWGTTDNPLYCVGLLGGHPWDVSHRYNSESAIYQLDKVRTPTHLVTGANDIRVPASQANILERGLQYLGVPVKLLQFPRVGHSLRVNPWHGKIKVREELKWLEKYGRRNSIR